jgi:hypothetical protein
MMMNFNPSPQRIGDYQLNHPIASTRNLNVYVVRQKKTNKRVIAKLILNKIIPKKDIDR